MLECYSLQGAEVAVPAPPRGQVRVRGLHAGPRQDGLGGLECGHLPSVQDRVQVQCAAECRILQLVLMLMSWIMPNRDKILADIHSVILQN